MSNVSMVDGHIDKEPKFTDEEIIENFNYCLSSTDGNCEPCIFKGVVCNRSLIGKIETLKLVADVLNRQQAEIERLTARNFELSEKGEKVVIAFKTAKAEAIKEFAERLKEYFNPDISYDIKQYIDNLVKEMVGENNAE